MNHKIPHLDDMSNEHRILVLRDFPDFLAKIARQTKKTKATVSRVLAGKISRSPDVRSAIDREIDRINNKCQRREAA